MSEITNKQTSDGERITQAQAQITANQNAIKLKVDEQVYTTDKKDMTSKLEKNTSEISAMKGQIALKVEQTDIDRTIEEIEVGAVNYALGTINAKTFTLNGADNQNIPCYPVLDNTSNQDVVVSFDYEFKDLLILDRGEIYFQAISTKEDGAIQYVPKVECFKNLLVDGNSSGSISFKTKFPAFKAGTTLNFRFRSNNLQGTFIISNVQVELGNKKTNWKANPADIETKVEEKISSAKAEIKVETGKISQSVSKLETTTTELAGKVTNQESRLSSAEQKITDKAITSVVQESQFIKDMNNKVSSNTSLIEQTANQISSKVSREDFESYKTQTASEISSKITSKDVSSIIRQSSNDIQIGFNGINDRININPTSMDFRAINNNRDMSLYGGQVCIYNNANDTFMSTMGSVLKSDTSYKGVGFLLGKNANIFTIGRDATWTDVMTNRSPNPTHYVTFNFDTSQADIDMELNTNGINMRGNTLRNSSALGTDKLQTNTWYDLGNNPLFTLNDYWQHVDMYRDLEANYNAILNARLVNPQTSYALASGLTVDINNDADILIANEDISEVDAKGNVSYDLNEMIKLLYSKMHDLEKEVASLKQENNELKLLLNKGE